MTCCIPVYHKGEEHYKQCLRWKSIQILTNPVAIAALQLIVKVLYVVVYTGYQLSNYYVGIRLSPIYTRIL